jgi:type IV conjugative transfer system protein TraE
MTEEIKIKMQNNAVMRQRNFFAGCLALAVGSSFLLSIKLATMSEKVVMVPGINKEMTVEGVIVSQSYIEETALLFLSALLDLTPNTAAAKRDIILKHASKRSTESLKSLQEYFALAIDEHKKFGLSTFFAPKKLLVDNKKLQVIAIGTLSSTFGKRGFEEKEVQYRLSFDYVGGYLQIKEFVQLKKNEDKEGKE